MKEGGQFYTETSAQRFAPTQPAKEAPIIDIQKSNSGRRLMGRFLDVYSNTNTTVFNNGDPLEYPRSASNKDQFEGTLTTVIADKCADLFTEDGKIKPESTDTWVNIMEIAPKVTEALLSENHYIGSVNRSRAANTAAFAIDVARNPALLGETVISTGFGGSDDEYTTTRFPAYSLPALSISRDLREFYEEREEKALRRARRNKIFERLVSADGHSGDTPLDKTKRKEFDRIANSILDNSEEAANHGLDLDEFEITDDEKAEIRQANGIATKMPTVRFFFADQAAIAINHTMQPDGIRIRTAENMTILRDFFTENFPDISENVEITEDRPWTEHTPYQRLVIDYCADLLRTSDDASIQETIGLLEKLGGNHGGEAGRERAAEYAAIHPLVFQDRLSLPYASYMQGVGSNPVVNISIGGNTERSFCAVRDYLSANATSQGLLEFIDRRLDTGGDPDEYPQLMRIAQGVRKWEDEVEKRRNRYSSDSLYVARPDRPNLSLELITTIGRLPTYYRREGYDQPYGTDIERQIDSLRSEKPKGDTATEHMNHDLATKAVVFDLEALRNLRRERTAQPV